MDVTVRHFAGLRERRGVETETVSVPEGATLRDLYATLFAPLPAGRLPVACVRNLQRVPEDTALVAGDQVAFLPPFGGG